jgi:hypothetical protein
MSSDDAAAEAKRYRIAFVFSASPRRKHRSVLKELLKSITRAYGDDPDKACARFCTEVGLAWSTSGERWPHQGDGEIHTQIKGAFAQLCAKLQSKPCLDNLNDVVNWELEKEQLLVSCATFC